MSSPSIVMMVFTSIYGVVDGLFVSNYVGKTPFAAANLIMPFLMIMGAVGFMFGTGGSAVVSQALGEGKPDKAKQYFSMMVYVVIGCGLVLTLLGLVFLRPIGSAFFTALGNGVVSATISFLRTLLFQIAAVLILPLLLGPDGIWLSIVAAEFLALIITVIFFVKKGSYYHYS